MSAVAGSWYPGDRASVTAEIERMVRIASVAPSLAGRPIALVVPHAGWRYSGAAAAAAFRNLHAGDFARVVLIGPSHHGAFAGFSVSDAQAYRTPLGDVPVCAEAAGLRDGQIVRDVPGADVHEHSLEIEIPFLQRTLGSFCLVPILAGETTAPMEQRLAQKLAPLDDGKTLFVVSSDFTHYGPSYHYTPFGPSAAAAHDKIADMQRQAIGLLEKKDAAGFRRFLAATGATICGRRGISVLLELLPRIAPQAQSVLLAQYASSELPGTPGDDSVWYVALAYVDKSVVGSTQPMGLPPEPPTSKEGR
jgi:AmmeMemoRadiSam system protein B